MPLKTEIRRRSTLTAPRTSRAGGLHVKTRPARATPPVPRPGQPGGGNGTAAGLGGAGSRSHPGRGGLPPYWKQPRGPRRGSNGGP